MPARSRKSYVNGLKKHLAWGGSDPLALCGKIAANIPLAETPSEATCQSCVKASQSPEYIHGDLLREALEFSAGWTTPPNETPYKPFDQETRIPYWADRGLDFRTPEGQERSKGARAWENAHGHDIRSKCIPEYGCQVIESYSVNLIQRLIAALEAATQ